MASNAGDKACPQLLEAMVETLKDAVGMYIHLSRNHISCAVIRPRKRSNMAARKARLRLFAMATSSEESLGTVIGDSAYLGLVQDETLFEETVFEFTTDHVTSTFVGALRQSISQNANLVRHLLVDVFDPDQIIADQFLRDLFSIDGAFPSIQGACLRLCYYNGKGADLSPHIMKHVRSLKIYISGASDLAETPPYLKQLGNMIRSKDYGIEEVIFDNGMLKYGCAEVLDDTLRNVRSFCINHISKDAEALLLAASFERTKADGDKLARVRLCVSLDTLPTAPALIETIVRSSPNLQVLELDRVSHSTFNVLCDVVTTSILTKLKVCVVLRANTECSMMTEGIGKLLQHPTIRDLDLTIAISENSHVMYAAVADLMQSVAEGLRATRLRRFHCTTRSYKGIGSPTMTKLYEGVRENRNLMDIQLKLRPDLSRCRFPFLDFVSSRNQYLCCVLMRDENTLPPGLWPLILESASDEASILYYLLTLNPHLVKYQGNVRRTPDADIDKSVDGPSRKHTRIN